MRRLVLLLPLIALAGLAAFWAFGQGAPDPARRAAAIAPTLRPVLVELFTSQGCSSCPPADEFLGRLAREPNIIAISRPVTYWDRLGWRDTLARPENTALQRAYVARRAADEAYTPQAVVQGATALIGGREGAVHRAIDEIRARPGPRFSIEAGSAGPILILDGTAARPAQIRLVALRARVTVAIGRGENGGHSVDYTNVVIADDVIGAWRGGPLRLPIAAPRLHVPGADRYAVIVQEPDAGQVLTAGFL